jgi:hypothetical protein
LFCLNDTALLFLAYRGIEIMLQDYTAMVTGSVELVRVVQQEEVRTLHCSGYLECSEGHVDLLQVAIPGRPMIVAELSPYITTQHSSTEKLRFSVTFEIAEEEPLLKELFLLAHKSDGTFCSLKLQIPQSAIELEHIPECPSILLESITRRVEVEYQAFIDRGAGMALVQSQKPEFSIIITPGEPAQIFSAVRGIEQSLLIRSEVFIPEDGENGDLLANLRGVRRYQVTDGLFAGINQAITESRGRIVMLMDPRAIALTGAADIALNLFSASDKVGAVVGRVLRPDGLLYEAGIMLDDTDAVKFFGAGHQANGWEYLYEHDVDVASPTLAFFDRAMLAEMLFDTTAESIIAAYTTLSVNIRTSEKTIVYHPDIVSTVIAYDLERESPVLVKEVLKEAPLDGEDEDLDDIYYQGDVIVEPVPMIPRLVSSAVEKAGALVVLGHLTEDVVGESRLHRIFETLSNDGLAVTIFAMRGISCTPAQLRRDLPVTVQYADGMETPLSQFLEQNKGVYDMAVVWQLAHLRKVLDAVKPYNMPVVCDVSGREVFSETERALMRKVSTVWVEEEREARRLRNIGIHHTEVVSLLSGSGGSESLAALLLKLRSSLLSQTIS